MKKVQISRNKYLFVPEEIDETIKQSDIKEFPCQYNTNQIYFYEDITNNSILNLNKNLEQLSKHLLLMNINYNFEKLPNIELYINSQGGEILSAFSTVDRIKSSKVPVYSYVDGVAASAATLISVVAHKRFIRKNSFMLIHQLSSEIWGNFQQIKEETRNLEVLMTHIKDIYLKHTKFTEEELDNILKKDIYLNAEQCLEKGLVDSIIT